MAAPRGKRVAILAGALVLPATAAGIYVTWDRIREEWYLYRLEHLDKVVRYHAAEKLGDLRCARAIPRLLVFMEEEEGWPQVVFPPDTLWYEQFCGPPHGTKETVLLDPLSYALFKIGPEALPHVIREQKDMPRLGKLARFFELSGHCHLDGVILRYKPLPPTQAQ